MWLVPSQDPDQLHTFFAWCRDTGISSSGIVLVEEERFERLKEKYQSLIAPPGWGFHLTKSDDYVGQVIEAKALYWEQPWVGLMGDDCIPLSIQWEKTALAVLSGWNVVSINNDNETIPAGIGRGSIWSGDLMRAIGALFFESFSEDAQYEIWENITQAAGAKAHKGEIVIRRPGWTSDHVCGGDAVRGFLEHRGDELCGKVEELRISKGVMRWHIDFTGLSVMIAVPSGAGSLGYEFLGCLDETYRMFGSAGVTYQFVIEPHNADIVMARSRLFAKFLRSTCTHLLMIDDDMGWTPQDVGRLFAAKKDFVAVAGPKKRVPLQCAVTPLPLDKNYGRINMDHATGTVEVKEVGGAFNLYTRAFADKMIAAYPELAYAGVAGETEYSLFMPLIHEMAYKAEDYAICHRWRAIGGGVHVCPDVSLKHIGRWTYEGSWAETWPKTDPRTANMMKEAAE